MREQDLDQRPGAGGVAAGASGGVPVGLVRGGERPAGLGLRQRGRAGQPAGFGLEHLEVVIQGQDLDVASDRPFVAGDQLRRRRRSRPCGRRAGPAAGARRSGPGRSRSTAAPTPGPGCRPALRSSRAGSNASAGNGISVARLDGERGADRDRPAGDHPVVVEQVAGGDQLVQLRQRGDLRDRDEVAAAEPADLALDAALLVRARRCRGGRRTSRTRSGCAAR